MAKHEQSTGVNSTAVQRAAGSAPRSDVVDFRDKVDILQYEAAAGTGQRHPLKGFDPGYTDIVDYIMRCTHKMWEEGGIGLLYEHYTQNITVWSDWGATYGREQTIGYVVQRLAGFPDWRIYGDDVIWTGDDERGFRTCHRAVQIGHNYGWSKYGPPTGRRVQFRGVAHCVARENYIHEEWLVHDELTIVRQLGLDVDEALRHLTEQMDAGGPRDIAGEPVRTKGQLTPPVYAPRHPDAFDVEDFVRQGMNEIWNWRLLNKIPLYYARHCPLHGPANRELYGLGDIKAFVINVIAAFPDAAMEIDDLYFNGTAEAGYRTAVRWTLTGTHRGYGIYGRPTGKQVHIMGTTMQTIKDGKIIEEYTIFNELALLWRLRYA